MAMISINVPDSLLEEAKRVLAPVHRDVEDYLLCALYDLTSEESGCVLDAGTEAALLEGLKSPLIELTEADWESKLRPYGERHRGPCSDDDAAS